MRISPRGICPAQLADRIHLALPAGSALAADQCRFADLGMCSLIAGPFDSLTLPRQPDEASGWSC